MPLTLNCLPLDWLGFTRMLMLRVTIPTAAALSRGSTLNNTHARPPPHRISFLHYHKTGHDLSRVLASAVSSTLAIHKTKSHLKKRKRSDNELSCSGRDEVQVWTAPELFQRIAPVPSCNIIVHMVRDPASWAISSYDYHRQDPTPESWVKHAKPACTFQHRKGWNASTEVLGLDSETVGQLVAACTALVQPGKTYWQHLRNLTEADGLRLMAFFNIFGTDGGFRWRFSDGGDLTRSAANALSFRAVAATPDVMPPLVANLWMDVVIQDLAVAMAGLADFLVSSLGRDASHRTGERRRLADALVEQLGSALVTAQEAVYQEQSKYRVTDRGRSHVTSNTTSIEAQKRKARLTASLYDDALLGPVHRQWRRVLGVGDAPPPPSPPLPPSPPPSPLPSPLPTPRSSPPLSPPPPPESIALAAPAFG